MSAIFTSGLTKRFGQTLALDSLDLEVGEGEVFGFLGPNGAGKTTTIRLLLGLLRPSAGRAELFGMDSVAEAVNLHRRVAYVPGEFSIWPWLTGGEALDYLGRLHGSVDTGYRERLVRRFELDPDKKGRSYSTGNKQKVAVIAAFSTRADLLILDEPTAGLDPLKVAVFRDCIDEARDRGQTVFISSHILSEVEATCDRVAILRAGRLVEVGRIDEMRHLSARSVEITFEGEPPELSGVRGVAGVRVTGRTVSCRVTGDMSQLIARLAGTRVVDLVSEEASLEEIFLAHYGE